MTGFLEILSWFNGQKHFFHAWNEVSSGGFLSSLMPMTSERIDWKFSIQIRVAYDTQRVTDNLDFS